MSEMEHHIPGNYATVRALIDKLATSRAFLSRRSRTGCENPNRDEVSPQESPYAKMLASSCRDVRLGRSSFAVNCVRMADMAELERRRLPILTQPSRTPKDPSHDNLA